MITFQNPDMKVNPLDQFESDQKLLNEIKDLFEFVPPATLRRNLEDLFFAHFSSLEEVSLPNQKELIKNFYYLINFLNEVENKWGWIYSTLIASTGLEEAAFQLE